MTLEQARSWGRGDRRRLKTSDIPAAVVALIEERQGGKFCVACRAQKIETPEDEPMQLDHRQPLSKGGDNRAFNLQWVCRAHNLGRGNRRDFGEPTHARGPRD